MFIKNLVADFLKMKRTPVTLAHILIPVMISSIFLAYYSFSAWDGNTKIIAFYQAIGAGFPVLIGIFTASMMEQEQNAGEFQNLLTLPGKRRVFLSKIVLLLMFSLFAVLLASALFAIPFCKNYGNNTINAGICMVAALLMWCSSIPLYIWQMILAFQFGKGVSIGAGMVSGLVSALLLTGLGNVIWKYTFISWTGRIPCTYLKMVLGESHAIPELKAVIPVYCIVITGSILCYLLWAFRFEGSKISE